MTEYRTTQTQRPLSKVSASKYVEAVRRRYHALATDNGLLDALYAAVPDNTSPADREAEITRLLRYVNNNANVEHNRIKLPDRKTMNAFLRYAALAGIAGSFLAATAAWAEKADRDKPVNIEADRVSVDDVKKVQTFEGNVSVRFAV